MDKIASCDVKEELEERSREEDKELREEILDGLRDEKVVLDTVAAPRIIRIEPASADEETLVNVESVMLIAKEGVQVTKAGCVFEEERISVKELLVIVREGVIEFVVGEESWVTKSNSEDSDKVSSVREQLESEREEEVERKRVV